MELVSEAINHYCESHSTGESDTLKHLNRYTHANVLHPRMLSGHLQGRFLSMISKMIKPVNILEIGTYTGYSALCMAEGLQPHGKLVTIDVNAELEHIVRNHIAMASMEKKFSLLLAMLTRLSEPFHKTSILFLLMPINLRMQNITTL